MGREPQASRPVTLHVHGVVHEQDRPEGTFGCILDEVSRKGPVGEAVPLPRAVRAPVGHERSRAVKRGRRGLLPIGSREQLTCASIMGSQGQGAAPVVACAHQLERQGAGP